MRLRMIAVLGTLIALSIPALTALDLRAGPGGASAVESRRSLSTAALGALAGPLLLDDGSMVRGLALGEVLPLLGDAWRIDVRGGGGQRTWTDDGFGERLWNIWLVEPTDAGPSGAFRLKGDLPWDLVIGRERFRGADSITIAGDILVEDGLEVWLSWEGVPELKAEIARFAASHGKKIKATEVPQIQSKLSAVARGGGKLPDVVMIQSDYVPALAGGKLIQGVDWFRIPDLEPKGYEAFSSEGHSWAIPFYYDTQLVFYNRALAGGPIASDWSLEDLVTKARALKGRIKAPLAWNVYSAYWLLPFMVGFGKDRLIEPGGGMTVNDAPTAAALRAILGLMDEGLLVPAERDAMVSWFAAGQAAFILAGSYSIPEFSRLGLDFGVAPYPLARKGGRPIAPLLDFKGFALSRRTEKPVLARRLIQALVSQGFQARFTSALGKLPASRAALEASRSLNPWYIPLAHSAKIGVIVPPAESYAVFKNVMWKLLRFLLTGQQGVEETLATAQRLINEGMEPR